MIQNSHRLSYLHTLQLPISLLFFFVGVIFGFTEHYVTSIIFVSAGIMSLFFGYALSGISCMRKYLKYHHTISVTQPKSSVWGILFVILMRNGFFIKLDGYIRNTVLSGSIKTGELPKSAESSRKTIIAFVYSIPVCVILAFVIIISSGQIFFVSLIAVPFFILLLPRISNLLLFADSSAGYDKDLAYFLSYLHISHLGKMNLYHSMMRLINQSIFPAIERDAKMLQRWVDFDGMTEFFAINQLAGKHANKTFQSFLFAYFDISKTQQTW